MSKLKILQFLLAVEQNWSNI